MDKIFIQIVAYRDKELVPTVKEAIARAAYPDRLTFGICWQYASQEELDYIEQLRPFKNCRIVAIAASQARGVGWARALVQKLWQQERYTLQIDAHMRFADRWDAEIIEMLAMCPSEKAILSAYPPAYEPPRNLLDDTPTCLEPKDFSASGILSLKAGGSLREYSAPQPGMFIAAGYIFAEAKLIGEVPYDPQIYFGGEEVLLATRAWTRGWDIYHPHRPLCWHFYNSGGQRPVHWSDREDWWVFNRVSEQRFRQILGMETPSENFDIYGLGNVRSLAEYEYLAGVDFQKRSIVCWI